MVVPPVAVPSHARSALSPSRSYCHSTSSGKQLIPNPSVSSFIAMVTVKYMDIPEEYIVREPTTIQARYKYEVVTK